MIGQVFCSSEEEKDRYLLHGDGPARRTGGRHRAEHRKSEAPQGQRGANHGDGFAVEREQSDALLAERRRKRGDGGRQRLGLCEEGRNDGHHGECAGRQRRQRNLLRDRDRAGIGAENHHLPAG